MYKLIDGKKIATNIEEKIKKEVSSFLKKPKLVAILVGEDKRSKTYVNIKKKKCEEIGIEFELIKLEQEKQSKLIEIIQKLNNDEKVTGILVQLPLPDSTKTLRVFETISYLKDVDGVNPINIGRSIIETKPHLIPCTAKGITTLLNYYKVNVKGKNVVVIGKSHIVGFPIAREMIKRDATVTICDINTINLKSYTIKADILIVATGVKNLIKEDMIKFGVVIFDVGITKEVEQIYGDVDFEKVKHKASLISTHPYGVGPLTVASLLENIIIAFKNQGGK